MARYLAAGIALSVWFGLRQAAGVHLSELPDSTGVGLLLERGHLVLASYGKLLLVPWPLSTGRTLEWMREPPAHVLLGLVAVVGLAALLIADDLVIRAFDATEQLPYRSPQRLAVNIPQGHVDCTQADDDPAPAISVQHTIVEFGPQSLRMDRIFTQQQPDEK